MAVTMQKSKATKVYKQEELGKPEISCCQDIPNQKIQLETPIQLNAAMGLGLGGNNIISDKPQTIDQIPKPIEMPKQKLMLSERDLVKILEEQ